MSQNNWNREDWEQNVYQTGSTRPPKNHRTTVALLLVAVILLSGVVSALSLLNIHLFRQNNSKDKELMSFHSSGETSTSAEDESATTETSVSAGEKRPQLQLSQSPLSVENVPQQGGLSLQSIYEKAIDSVVSVSCTTRKGTSSGTGVVLSADGYVVTNCHVVEKAVSVQVLLNDGTTCDAAVVGVDAASDLAVLYVQAQLTPAEFGDSSALRVGDCVVAIGDPLGIELRGTMTDGIVSAINRDISTGGRTMTLIQTNAALNSGNSGGPLLNCYGQVVGINTMKIGDYMSEAGVEGLGFAIPSTTVKDVVEQLITKGQVSGRPTFGIAGQEISAFEQHYYRIPQGIYITEVDENSDAAKKGICPGDILLQADGVRITDTDALKEQLYAHQAGDTVSIVIYRRGKQYTLEIVLGEQQ